jgi:hypothetical protein
LWCCLSDVGGVGTDKGRKRGEWVWAWVTAHRRVEGGAGEGSVAVGKGGRARAWGDGGADDDSGCESQVAITFIVVRRGTPLRQDAQ